MPRKKKHGQAPASELPPLGLFSRPSYLSEGDPYVKKNIKKDARYTGKQILSTVPKSGKTLDAFFEKQFTPLFRDEPYIEPHRASTLPPKSHKRRGTSTLRTKPLAGPWRPNNPSRSDPGAAFPHEPDYRVQPHGETSAPVFDDSPSYSGSKDTRGGGGAMTSSSRGFFTNPGRKGGPGTAGRFVGMEPARYEPVRAGDDRERAKRERERERAKRIGPAFKSRVAVVDSFDGGKVYAPPEKVPKGSRKAKKQKAARPMGGPWKHASGIKTFKYDSAFGSTYPKYEPDPVDQREKRMKNAAKTKGKPLGGPFITTFKTTDDLPSKVAKPVPPKW